jgi:hypothetical protein
MVDVKVVSPEPSLNDRLKGIEDTLNAVALKKSKVKDLKIEKWGWKNKIKKNYVIVEWVRRNGRIEFQLLPIVDDCVQLPKIGTYHLATINYILMYKNYPVLIIYEGNIVPWNPKDDMSKEDNLALAMKVILTKVEQAQAGLLKKNVNMKSWLIIGLVAAAAIYLASKYLGGSP